MRPRITALCEVLPSKKETIATLPGGWDLAHAIRLGIKLFAELGQLAGIERVPCRFSLFLPSDLQSAPVAMLQSPKKAYHCRCNHRQLPMQVIKGASNALTRNI